MSDQHRTRYPLAQTAFLNVGHAYTHLFLLLYPTVVLALERDLARSYAELIALSTWSFAALGLMTYPAGWLGDPNNQRYLKGRYLAIRIRSKHRSWANSQQMP